MPKSVDQTVMKEINRTLVLDLIRLRSPISRTQIARDSGLNKATLTALINDLIGEGYVLEVGHGQSNVGRKPVLLQFNGQLGTVFGLDIGVDYLKFVVTDFGANILFAHQRTLPDKTNVAAIVDACVLGFDTCRAQVATKHHALSGVGVAVPGLVDHRSGTVLHAPNLGWRDVPLQSLLEDRMGQPVWVDNEANVAALAEQRYGSARDLLDFVYISAGIGIGTGLISDGRPLRGANGMAGEFGHMTIDHDGPLCRCGNRGCLEIYASERALLDHFERISGKAVSFESFRERLLADDPDAAASTAKIAGYLAIGILNLLNGLNPSAVYLGNQLGRLSDWLIPPIVQTLSERSLTAAHAAIDIRASALGDNAGVIGAAALAIDHHLNRNLRNLGRTL
ncbi:MAG: ROK family protein [Firmicutes bacterium]|nr:ROK family protein [Bacillota bacterium]